MIELDLSVIEKLAKDDDNVKDLLIRLQSLNRDKSKFVTIIIMPAIKKKAVDSMALGCFWNACDRNLAVFAAFMHRVPHDITLLISISYMIHNKIPDNVNKTLVKIAARIKQDFDEANINWKSYEA